MFWIEFQGKIGRKGTNKSFGIMYMDYLSNVLVEKIRRYDTTIF